MTRNASSPVQPSAGSTVSKPNDVRRRVAIVRIAGESSRSRASTSPSFGMRTRRVAPSETRPVRSTTAGNPTIASVLVASATRRSTSNQVRAKVPKRRGPPRHPTTPLRPAVLFRDALGVLGQGQQAGVQNVRSATSQALLAPRVEGAVNPAEVLLEIPGIRTLGGLGGRVLGLDRECGQISWGGGAAVRNGVGAVGERTDPVPLYVVCRKAHANRWAVCSVVGFGCYRPRPRTGRWTARSRPAGWLWSAAGWSGPWSARSATGPRWRSG